MQAQTVKTDRNDARALAQMMRTGWFKAVHIKSDNSQKLRALMGSRRCLLDKQSDLNNHIRAALRTFGFKVGLIGQSRFEERVRELIVADGDLQALVVPLLEARRMLGEQARALTRLIGRLVRSDATCRRFMTVPGVGPLTVLAFKTTIDNPGRFRKSRHVGVHLGLTPGKYASGEVDYNGRITRCGDTFDREHLFEAAHSLMVNTRRWCSLEAWGIRIAKRSSMKNALVAVARKISVILHRMWCDGSDFRWERSHLVRVRRTYCQCAVSRSGLDRRISSAPEADDNALLVDKNIEPIAAHVGAGRDARSARSDGFRASDKPRFLSQFC